MYEIKNKLILTGLKLRPVLYNKLNLYHEKKWN